MPYVSYPVEMISGVPVVTAPAEIDLTTADQLRRVLLEATAHGHTTVVVDMTRTRFCDSAGLSVLARAHKRALEEGGELRLAMPAGGAVFRIFTLTSLHRFIPRFDSLQEALLQRPAVAIRPLRPPARLGDCAAVAAGQLGASVADRESGPVITLSGEADFTSAAQLNALITVQLSGGTRHLTIDVSGASFADSATIRVLVLAARTLSERGGTLVLLHPQPAVARLLAVTGAEQMFTIRGETHREPEAESEARLPARRPQRQDGRPGDRALAWPGASRVGGAGGSERGAEADRFASGRWRDVGRVGDRAAD